MILRFHALSTVPFLLHLAQAIIAQEFNCKPIVQESQYDFTSLGNGPHVVNRTRETPPTRMRDSLAFDLCGDLKPIEGLAEQDQCPSGTRACLTQSNFKNESERIVSVIPLAQTSKLEHELTISPKPPRFLTLILHASGYPDPESSPAQSLNMTLWCDPDMTEPTMTIDSYDDNQLMMTYTGPAGCPIDGKNPDGDKEDPVEPPGSGIGWFFMLLLLAFVAYFAIGAYYNYSTYGARGLDLIPHRDFWQEVPYMLRDVVSHMCSSARPRRSERGGYIAV